MVICCACLFLATFARWDVRHPSRSFMNTLSFSNLTLIITPVHMMKTTSFFMELEFLFWVLLDVLEICRNGLDLSGLKFMDDARGNFIWNMRWPHLVWASSNVVLAQCCPVHCPWSCSLLLLHISRLPSSVLPLQFSLASRALGCLLSSELPL